MEELFDSKAFRLRYDEKTNACVFTLIEYGDRDDFRTPMMHAADMVLRHSCKILMIDAGAEYELSEADITWSRKVLFANLKKSGLETLVFIDSCGLDIVKKCAEFCEDRFKTVICKDYEEGLKLAGSNVTSSSSDDKGEDPETDRFATMSREEALE